MLVQELKISHEKCNYSKVSKYLQRCVTIKSNLIKPKVLSRRLVSRTDIYTLQDHLTAFNTDNHLYSLFNCNPRGSFQQINTWSILNQQNNWDELKTRVHAITQIANQSAIIHDIGTIRNLGLFTKQIKLTDYIQLKFL